jgi:precorrin-6A/cobalt-precorrin-6A reductase
MALPYLRWLRPAALAEETGLTFAADHAQAAAPAFSFGAPVLLTIGSKNLEPYVRESRRTGLPVIARVLDHPDSRATCQKQGLAPEAVVTGKGPFSEEQNRALIRKFGIGVLVTKDSGKAGGVPEKLEAARQEGCRVVVVRRPEQTGEYFEQMGPLVKKLLEVLA